MAQPYEATMPPPIVYRRAEGSEYLEPTTDQRNTIIVACVYALAILILVGTTHELCADGSGIYPF